MTKKAVVDDGYVDIFGRRAGERRGGITIPPPAAAPSVNSRSSGRIKVLDNSATDTKNEGIAEAVENVNRGRGARMGYGTVDPATGRVSPTARTVEMQRLNRRALADKVLQPFYLQFRAPKPKPEDFGYLWGGRGANLGLYDRKRYRQALAEWESARSRTNRQNSEMRDAYVDNGAMPIGGDGGLARFLTPGERYLTPEAARRARIRGMHGNTPYAVATGKDAPKLYDENGNITLFGQDVLRAQEAEDIARQLGIAEYSPEWNALKDLMEQSSTTMRDAGYDVNNLTQDQIEQLYNSMDPALVRWASRHFDMGEERTRAALFDRFMHSS